MSGQEKTKEDEDDQEEDDEEDEWAEDIEEFDLRETGIDHPLHDESASTSEAAQTEA